MCLSGVASMPYIQAEKLAACKAQEFPHLPSRDVRSATSVLSRVSPSVTVRVVMIPGRKNDLPRDPWRSFGCRPATATDRPVSPPVVPPSKGHHMKKKQ